MGNPPGKDPGTSSGAPSRPPSDTPAMRQFKRFKEQHPGCVLFFRMGDFYEMFYEDAKLASRVLGVTLTQRTEGVPMSGVPYHAVERYLRRMVQAGYRVAVCDQVEDPAKAKGVVKRDVTRVVTPGTLTEDSLLEEGKDNPLAAVMFLGESRARESASGAGDFNSRRNVHNQTEPREHASVAWAELSTGAFHIATFTVDELPDELARIVPRELLFVETANGKMPDRVQTLVDHVGCASTTRPAWQFRQAEAVEALCKQFQVVQLDGFGLAHDHPALGPAAAIVHYLVETQMTATAGDAVTQTHSRIAHLQPPRTFEPANYLVIDRTSLHSLEVETTMRTGETHGSLLGVLQSCRTAMGKRMLRHWLAYPLRQREPIQQRQRVVTALVEDERFAIELAASLDQVQDVERIIGRISVARASPRDVVALGHSANQAVGLAQLLADRPAVKHYCNQLVDVSVALAELAHHVANACVDDDVPAHLREGGLFRDGFDVQLDEYRGLQRDSDSWLAQYQKQLIDQTGITSLKVGFNKVFGYYIELTAANRDKAPDNWTRKQTLKNAERFITSELKEYEGKVLSARERAIAREQSLFAGLCNNAQKHLPKLHTFAQAVAELDVLACFARRAARHQYVLPMIVDGPVLQITAGRHPVLDEMLGDRFVPNDVELGGGPTLALITGPNMAGKSTYIRQTALIVLLAHTGAFVPAAAATIGLCDRIFTRIGAADELHAGQSTFMVEMTETASICHYATPNSLIILDEIGRGTSTLDGLSLAWAIAEYLSTRGCRTLFATHYHELTQLAEQHDSVTNLNVTVREWQDQVVFLHRIVPGAANRSYGIHVARIAGLPGDVVQRATDLLGQLAVSHEGGTLIDATSPAGGNGSRRCTGMGNDPQMSLFATEYIEHPAIDRLRHVELEKLSPLEAFDLLRQLRDEVTEAGDE